MDLRKKPSGRVVVTQRYSSGEDRKSVFQVNDLVWMKHGGSKFHAAVVIKINDQGADVRMIYGKKSTYPKKFDELFPFQKRNKISNMMVKNKTFKFQSVLDDAFKFIERKKAKRENKSAREYFFSDQQSVSAEVYEELGNIKKWDAPRKQREAQRVFKIIDTLECRQHMRLICSRQVESTRLYHFLQSNPVERKRECNGIGTGPFECDRLASEVMRKIDQYVEPLDKAINNPFLNRVDLMTNVLLPEAVLFALMKLHNITLSDAENAFTLQNSCPEIPESDEFYAMERRDMEMDTLYIPIA